jgi:hypothetical protein
MCTFHALTLELLSPTMLALGETALPPPPALLLELRRHACMPREHQQKVYSKSLKKNILSIFEWKKVLWCMRIDRAWHKQPVQPHQPTVCASI